MVGRSEDSCELGDSVTHTNLTMPAVGEIDIEVDPRDRKITDVRPWGCFEQFVANTPCTVKIITVDPGCRLSLQTHQLRGELWRVLDSQLMVTVGDATWCARRDDDIWVPRGVVHRMSNHTDAPVRVLEIAFGEFDENDICRLEDDYAR